MSIISFINLFFSKLSIEYSKINNIAMIMQKKSIVIGKSDLEITDKILEIVNQKIKKIDLN